MAKEAIAMTEPRINLLPRSETQRRERERQVRGWVWGVLGAILLTLLVIAAAIWFRFSADQRLAAEQAETNNLLLELSSLSEVSGALAAEQELTDFRESAMASDIQWSPVIASVVSALPAGAVLTGFDVSVGGAPQGDDPTLETALTGRFWVTSPVPIDIVPTIRSVRGVEGVSYADGQSLTADGANEGAFAYELNVTFDQTIYSGLFAPATAEED